MKKALVVIPTFNERDNVQEMIPMIMAVQVPRWQIEVLVVDSNSPDGTGRILEDMKLQETRLHVCHQSKKLGLGKAYLDGFRYLEERLNGAQFDAVFTMDADFSHHPRYLAAMLEKLEKCDLVVGSRYIVGGSLENWPWDRKVLSRFANFYAKTLTGVPIHDLTAGFHCFRRETLRNVLKLQHLFIDAEGYAFLIELKFLTVYLGYKVGEVPIIFADRTKGVSKISERVIFESSLIPWKCLMTRIGLWWRKVKR
ncbi:MAG: polyprenol monophosphomannose synthase [Candidatus Omnitrophica bacterium]|nr:polyprenol monophosphomannose synthase [Candidatus Omnitrophota bacterium]